MFYKQKGGKRNTQLGHKIVLPLKKESSKGSLQFRVRRRVFLSGEKVEEIEKGRESIPAHPFKILTINVSGFPQGLFLLPDFTGCYIMEIIEVSE